MAKRSAIELLLRKQEYCFPNARKTCTRRCGDFRNKPTNLFSLVKHHIYNKVYPCICFCKGNCSWRQQSSLPEVNCETINEKKGNLVSAKVNNRDILLLFRLKWLSLYPQQFIIQIWTKTSIASKWCTNACQPPMETYLRISKLLNVELGELLNKKYIDTVWNLIK